MTDNEKAASYLPDWKLGMKCTESRWTCSHWLYDDYSPHPHDIAAPDMSKPENYMRALFSLDALEIIFQEYDGLNLCIFKSEYRDMHGQRPTAYGFDEDDWGAAAVMALAAYFDAEHKESKP